ncbi:hypothetical protein EMIT0P100_70141 [Pseudomonas sp. IT-P100]
MTLFHSPSNFPHLIIMFRFNQSLNNSHTFWKISGLTQKIKVVR